MAPTEVPELDRSPADLDGRVIREGPVRRVEDDLGHLVRHRRVLLRDAELLLLTGVPEEPERALLTPDRARPEPAVAEAVIVVCMRVHHDPDREVGERADIAQDLVALGVRDARVDDEGLVTPEDEADLLVVEAVAPHEHTVADLGPRMGHRHGC